MCVSERTLTRGDRQGSPDVPHCRTCRALQLEMSRQSRRVSAVMRAKPELGAPVRPVQPRRLSSRRFLSGASCPTSSSVTLELSCSAVLQPQKLYINSCPCRIAGLETKGCPAEVQSQAPLQCTFGHAPSLAKLLHLLFCCQWLTLMSSRTG